EEAILRPHELAELPRGEQLILCTGSQGEPMSAMTRIAYNDHPAVSVEAGDTVIISAKPIPGNELRLHDALNRLAKMGAEVLREEANRVLRELLSDDVTEIKLLQEHLHDALGGIVYDRTRRRPMVLPVIVEV